MLVDHSFKSQIGKLLTKSVEEQNDFRSEAGPNCQEEIMLQPLKLHMDSVSGCHIPL